VPGGSDERKRRGRKTNLILYAVAIGNRKTVIVPSRRVHFFVVRRILCLIYQLTDRIDQQIKRKVNMKTI